MFSPREFLRSRNALLVHFDSSMARHTKTFPENLLTAKTLRDKPLSFSTIMPGDTFTQSADGAAVGCVGLIADIGVNTKIDGVCSHDCGTNDLGSLAIAPNEQNCIDSIAKRNSSNEWVVRNPVPIGILILPQLMVRREVNVFGDVTIGDVQITLGEAVAPFPNDRIVGLKQQSFVELDRLTERWIEIDYDSIIPV